MKRAFRRLGLAAAFAAICVLALEVLLRLAAPIPLNSPRFRTSARYCSELWPSNDGASPSMIRPMTKTMARFST